MISPVRSSGRLARNTQARVNISAGPITQLRSRDKPRVRWSANSVPRWRYRTLASTGYIIASNPIAIGSETVPTLMRSSAVFRSGMARPNSSPVAIASPIHNGRNRSRVESFAATGSTCVVVIGPVPRAPRPSPDRR